MDEVEIRQERAHGERHYEKDAYEVITYSLKNVFGILKLKVTTYIKMLLGRMSWPLYSRWWGNLLLYIFK